jgi:hypothetical protein
MPKPTIGCSAKEEDDFILTSNTYTVITKDFR